MEDEPALLPGVLGGALALPWRDACTLLLSWLLLFLFARRFFSRWLFRDYEVKGGAAQLLFSLAFAFSFSLFQIVLFEVLGVLRVRSRQWVWRVDLVVMTCLLVLVLPLALFFTVAREFGRLAARPALVATLLALAAYLYGFWLLGAALESESEARSVDGASLFPLRLLVDPLVLPKRRVTPVSIGVGVFFSVRSQRSVLLDARLCEPRELAGRHVHGGALGLRRRQLPVRVPLGVLAPHRRGGHRVHREAAAAQHGHAGREEEAARARGARGGGAAAHQQ